MTGTKHDPELRARRARHRQHRRAVLRRHRRDRRARAHRDQHPRRRALAVRRGHPRAGRAGWRCWCWRRCVAYVPMASLAALLLLVAWNMAELHNFVGIVRVAPKSDVLVLLTCFLLTVFFDMVVAVSVGVVLAALLFMRRMAELTESRLTLDASQEGGCTAVPEGRRCSTRSTARCSSAPPRRRCARSAIRAGRLQGRWSSTSAASRSSTRPAWSRSRTRSRARSSARTRRHPGRAVAEAAADLRQGEAGEETRRAAHRQGRRSGGRTRRTAARRSQDTALRSRRAPGGREKK